MRRLRGAVWWLIRGPDLQDDGTFVRSSDFLRWKLMAVRGYFVLALATGYLAVTALQQSQTNAELRHENVTAICEGFENLNTYVYASAIRQKVRLETDQGYRRLLERAGPRLLRETIDENNRALRQFHPGGCALKLEPGRPVRTAG